MRNRQSQHRGFTLIELLVVISIIALLIAILLPSLARAKELANRAVCSANVRSIIQSMVIYAQSNGNIFPCTPPNSTASDYLAAPTPAPGAGATDYAGTVIQDWYKAGAASTTGDPLSCLWIMVLQNAITPKSFICPSDPVATTPSNEYVGGTAGSGANGAYVYSNFGVMANGAAASSPTNSSGQGESYSIAFPWSATGPAGWWNANAGSDIPLVSDMAPISGVGTGNSQRDTTVGLTNNTYGPYIFNSANHGGDGQNVGFGDDHVVFETNPYVGQEQDNIFTYWSVVGTPPVPSTGAGQTAPASATSGANAAYVSATGEEATPPYDIVMVPERNASTGVW